MAKQHQNGKLSEDIAAQFLIGAGYTILERNWRFSKAEIDIIAKDKEVLVFVEVKSKTYAYYGAPEESISSSKERLIIDAAGVYMQQIGYDWEIRFDIISILFDKEMKPAISHFKDAFYPGI
jgi:putative endonuclease